MKNPIINRIASALLSGACLLAATTGWSAGTKTVELWAKVVYLNPITGIPLASDVVVDPAFPPDGYVAMWGFSETEDGQATVPGPQINVDLSLNDGLAITVHNTLPEPISVVIPGLYGSAEAGQPVRFSAADASAAGDTNFVNRVRSFVKEVAGGASDTYNWTNLKPGTFLYHSGSHPALHVQMGLFGMLTVKLGPNQAYPGVGIGRGGEVSVIFSEIDPVLHKAVANGKYGPLLMPDGETPTGNTIGSTIHSHPTLFLINGRAYDAATPPAPLAPDMVNGWTTLFRVGNVCWNTRIPSLTGPFPSGGANYVKVIAENGELYPYAKTLFASPMSALGTADLLLTPTADLEDRSYQVSDRKLSLANGGGMFRQIAAKGTAERCIPATIDGSPVVILPAATVTDGNTVTLTAGTVSGSDTLVYAWRRNGVALLNGGYISGANSATLTLTAVPHTASGSYDLVVANSCGSATSPAATLTVNCATLANVIVTPASQTVDYGLIATFSVSPTGSAPFTYQWRKGSVPISGATSSTLVFAAAKTPDAGSYDVVVTDACGNSVTSPAATLTVNACISVAITTQPISQSQPLGGSATFTVAASGSPVLTYQWQKRQGNSGSTYNNIPGATSSSLTLSSLTATDFNNYRVLVDNDCTSGSGVQSAIVSLVLCTGAPTITSTGQPATHAATYGLSTTFTVTTSGTTPPRTFQWRKGGVNLVNGGNVSGATGSGTTSGGGGGTTSSTLTLSSVTSADADSYDVLVSNGCGTTTSAAATLTVNCPTPTASISGGSSQTFNYGVNASLNATASGAGPFTYQWRKYATASSSSTFTDIAGATSSALSFTPATSTDAGFYRVFVVNACGNSGLSGNVTVSVNCANPTINTQPASTSVALGADASFSVTATAAVGSGPLTYQWQKRSGNSGSTYTNIPSANNSSAITSTLTLPGVTITDANNYRVVVASACGTSVNSANASLCIPVAISTAPASQTVDYGASTSFNVIATGTSLTYQWQKYSGSTFTNIPGATSSTLNLSSVTSANAGIYRVVITDACLNQAIGGPATLTVNVGTLPSPWSTVDIGSAGITGNASESAGSYRVVGSGTGIPLTGTADQFRYLYQTLNGDGSITARLTSQSGTTAASLAGVMIRESTATDSSFGAVVRRGSGNNNMYSIRRTGTGVASSNSQINTTLTPPNCWVRVTRSGNNITMDRSSNGTTWTTINTTIITMAADITIGFVVTSGSNTSLDTGVFDNVTVVP